MIGSNFQICLRFEKKGYRRCCVNIAKINVAALGHDYTAAVTDPTCTAQGYTTYTCSRCDDSYKADYIDMIEHSWNNGEVTTDPTCTAKGVKTYTCSVCKATKTEDVAKLETAAESKPTAKNPQTSTEKPNTAPRTADDSNPGLWLALLVILSVGMAGVVLGRKKRTHNK